MMEGISPITDGLFLSLFSLQGPRVPTKYRFIIKPSLSRPANVIQERGFAKFN